jgi:hypothetical protein
MFTNATRLHCDNNLGVRLEGFEEDEGLLHQFGGHQLKLIKNKTQKLNYLGKKDIFL